MQLAILAACNLNQWALDFVGNRDRIIESIRQAKAKGQVILGHFFYILAKLLTCEPIDCDRIMKLATNPPWSFGPNQTFANFQQCNSQSGGMYLFAGG